MPVDDLGKLGMRMSAARNEMGLTQQRLSDGLIYMKQMKGIPRRLSIRIRQFQKIGA